MRLFRRLLPGSHAAHWSDEDILVALDAPSPTEWLRISRLRYLGTLYKCSPLVPWGLLNQDLPWTTLIEDDLCWLWRQLKESSNLPYPQEHLAAWINVWVHHPSYWRRLVRRGGEHAVLQRRRLHRVTQFHHIFAQLFQTFHAEEFGPRTPGAMPDATLLGDVELHACMSCAQTFKTSGGLGAHMFKRSTPRCVSPPAPL